MNEFVRVTLANIAQIFNMHPHKGTIAEGADADIVVWDPTSTKLISAKTHQQNMDYNIFEGMTVTGITSHTVSQGKVVFRDGELMVERAAGRYINRPSFAPYFDAIAKMRDRAAPISVKR
jgi:dihydropyrimidinase